MEYTITKKEKHLEPYRFRNTTDLYNPQITQYIREAGCTVERTSPDSFRFSFNNWIYDIKIRRVNEYTMSQNGLFFDNNEIKTDHTAKKFVIDFISHGDQIEIHHIKQNGKAVRSYKTVRDYCQILLIFNTLVRIGKIRV